MSVLPRSGRTLLQIDDASSRLVYQGSWHATTMNGTIGVHTSTSSGSTVTFAFNGMSFSPLIPSSRGPLSTAYLRCC